MKKLISLKEVSKMSIEDTHDLYRKYINNSKVNLLTLFEFGNDQVEKSEGCFIWTKSGKKIVDFTGGIGVLNHGHNHPRILDARRNFAKKKKDGSTQEFFFTMACCFKS